MRLVARKIKGHITAYSATIGSKEAREAGFLNADKTSKELIKFVDKDRHIITIYLKDESHAFEYCGYRTIVRFSQDDKCLHGKIEGIADLVSFDGNTLGEAEQEFRKSVDEYIAFCKEIGKEPCRPN